MPLPQLAFYVNLHRAVIGPSATLTGRWRPDIDLRRMLTGTRLSYIWVRMFLACLVQKFIDKCMNISLQKIMCFFQPKPTDNVFLFLNGKIYCKHSLEAPQRGAFKAYQQQMFSLRNKKSIYLINPLIWIYTVEPQWLEHLWDHGNSFETWVVRATEVNHGPSSGSK